MIPCRKLTGLFLKLYELFIDNLVLLSDFLRIKLTYKLFYSTYILYCTKAVIEIC